MDALQGHLPSLVAELRQFGTMSERALRAAAQGMGLLQPDPAYQAKEPIDLRVNSWRIALLLHIEVHAAYLRKKGAKVRSMNFNVHEQSNVPRNHAKSKAGSTSTLEGAAKPSREEIMACKDAKKAQREQKALANAKKRHERELQASGMLTNASRKRKASEL
jgi:hypothetical protein